MHRYEYATSTLAIPQSVSTFLQPPNHLPGWRIIGREMVPISDYESFTTQDHYVDGKPMKYQTGTSKSTVYLLVVHWERYIEDVPPEPANEAAKALTGSF